MMERNTKLLFKYLNLPISDFCILLVLRTGCDLNATEDGESLLHLAVKRPTIETALDLIKLGANVNAQNRYGETPIYYAIANKRFQTVQMLLYYGANVNYTSRSGKTPLTIALYPDKFNIAKILIDFYDKDDAIYYLTGRSYAYDKAARIFLPSLIEKGATVNHVDKLKNNPIMLTIMDTKANLFKLIWAKIDHRILTKFYLPLLEHYLNDCRFDRAEWLECLYLILNSPVAVNLVRHANGATKCGSGSDYLFIEILTACQKRNTSRDERKTLIYTLLSLNVKVHIESIAYIYNMFGFSDELTTLIYCGNYCDGYCSYNYPYKEYNLILPHLVTATKDFNLKKIFELFKREMRYSMNDAETEKLIKSMLYLLNFFAVLPYMRRKFQSLCRYDFRIMDKLEKLPQFPSLLELSRDQARLFIKKSLNVKKPYEFYDRVNTLNLPKIIEDVLCLRKPLY